MFNKYNKNDNWETPIEYLKCIEPYLPKDLTIHDPFYMNGNVKQTWAKLGRDIIHEDKNFFNIKPNDNKEIYCGNPPFSIFRQVLQHLFVLDKPFVLLIPICKLAMIKVQRILKGKEHVQVIPSPIYKGFINPQGEKTRCPSQYFCFLCYKLFLNRDFLYI
jgi:hypothetical protein